MRLADWQSRAIVQALTDNRKGAATYADVLHVIERTCSGGMATTGPDRISQELRKRLCAWSEACATPPTQDELGALQRSIRKLIADLMP